jgi:diphosphomevalonate decarboxylase
MTLAEVGTQTTVEFSPDYQQDEVWLKQLGGEYYQPTGSKKKRVTDHLKRFRRKFNFYLNAKVVSRNNLPMLTGLAVSASAFSALTAACISALNLKLSAKEQSILTRLAGSGSATRSVLGGFVKFKAGSTSQESFAIQLHDKGHWSLAAVVLSVTENEKQYPSLVGHQVADTSPFNQARLRRVHQVNQVIQQALEQKDFEQLGQAIEEELFNFHAVTMTSTPHILYWEPTTVKIIKQAWALRKSGLPVYVTIDAGPNVHLIVEQKNMSKVAEHFADWPEINRIYQCPVGPGVRSSKDHLF